MSAILSWDHAFLLWVNQGWACPALDRFFIFVTHMRNLSPVVVLLVGWWLWKGGAKGRWLVFALLVCVGITDQMSSHLIKDVVKRERPCRALMEVRAIDGCGPAYSFPSSHATNIGGAMTLVTLAFPASWPLTVFTALSVGFSRIYLGVHYPTDVLVGWILGFLCALGVWRLKGWAEGRWFRPVPQAVDRAPRSKHQRKKTKR